MDDSMDIDDDILLLETPPAKMKKWSNANKPIDIDGDENQALQRFTPEENELRRMLMMDHDVFVEGRKKRKEEDNQGEGSKRIKAPGLAVPEPARTTIASGSTEAQPLPPSIDALVAEVIAIIPDICPTYASNELQALINAGQVVSALEAVLTKAFDSGYPKPTKKAAEPGAEEQYLGKVFRAEKRRGEWYQIKCISALEEAFPAMPVGYIREAQNRGSFLFGPTYLALLEADKAPIKPYTQLKRPRLPAKGKTAMPEMDAGAMEFELEKNWILAHVAAKKAVDDTRDAQELADQAELDAGNGVECGCCFGEYVAGFMYNCPDGHLFCKDCCTRHVETKLGDEVHVILCMDTSGCQSRFADRELARLLPPKSYDLLHRLQLAEELEKAEIEGLENCPSCPWAVVIDNPDEKLFRCMNESCGKVSCRQCKKQEHLPKSCQEFAAEAKADKRHAVEDAMSEALIRKCPNCAKPYIKESGCNKIRCVKCSAYSCYICQKTITGYDHFDKPGVPTTEKCLLWDREEAQHDVDNVVRARDAAILEQRQRAVQEGIDIAAADLAVEAPAAAGPPAYALPRLMALPNYRQFLDGNIGDMPRLDYGRLAHRNLPNIYPGLLPHAQQELNQDLLPLGPVDPQVPRQRVQEWNQQRVAEERARLDAERLRQRLQLVQEAQEEERGDQYMDRLRHVREEENNRFQQVQIERRARRAAMEAMRERGERPQ